MSDLLAAVGLTPAPTDDTTPAPVEDPTETVTEPVADPTPVPIPEIPEDDDDVVAPEGAENPDAVVRAIKAERKIAREAYAKAKELERQLAERTEAAIPLEQRVVDATKRAEEATINTLRVTIAARNGILDLAPRLKGSTVEEIEEDAKTLLLSLATAPAVPVPAPNLNGGFQPQPAVKVDPNKAHNEFLSSLFAGRAPQQ